MIRVANVVFDRPMGSPEEISGIEIMSGTRDDGTSELSYWPSGGLALIDPHDSLSSLCDAYSLPIDLVRSMIANASVDWMAE